MKSNILVFEDDEALRELLELLLHSFNMDCQLSINPIPIAQVIRIAPDIIIMDYWLAEATAEKFCMQLKSHPSTRHIPILLLTANIDIAEIAGRCQADKYLSKPFDLEEFHNLLVAMST